MGALEELREAGTLGPTGARLLYDTVRAAVRFRNFPPPEGHQWWTQEAVVELAHDFLADSATRRRLATLAAEAGDDRQLAYLLNTAVVNFLRDRARRTDRGHLIARLREVLAESPDRFVRLPADRFGEELWARPGDVDAARWAGSLDELVVVAWRVDGLGLQPWTQAARRGPVADRESWQRLIDAVLAAAGGPVATRELVEVAANRFSVRLRPTTMPIDEADADPATLAKAPAEAAEVAESVRAVWPELSTHDRLVLAYPEASVRELAEVLGVGKSAAAEARTRLAARLQDLLGDDEDVDAVVGALAETAGVWLRRRTAPPDSPSHA